MFTFANDKIIYKKLFKSALGSSNIFIHASEPFTIVCIRDIDNGVCNKKKHIGIRNSGIPDTSAYPIDRAHVTNAEERTQ